MSDLPGTMRAVVTTGHGGLDRLEYREDWPVPRPAAGEVLIRVHAAALNNTDVNTRTAWYDDAVTGAVTAEGGRAGFADAAGRSAGWSGAAVEFPRIQGADLCGRIAAVGEGVDRARVGERVIVDGWLRDPHDPADITNARYFGSECDGSFAEYAVAPAANAWPVRSALDDAELASFPCAYATAENMVERPQVKAGDRVLVTGASGGVGTAAVQLCKRRGALVVAMASPTKHAAVRAVGADATIPRGVEDLAAALAPHTGDGRVDVVLDPVCGPAFGTLVGSLAPGGRYASCGALGGPVVTFDARRLIYRDLAFFGATVLPPRVFANLVGYIERGEVRPLLAQRFPLARLAEAQAVFLAKDFVGKIVIDVADGAGEARA